MRTGVAYMGHHDPRHIETDVAEMARLGCDDVLLAAQENDFRYFPGKLKFTADIADRHGMRPVVIFWGALNLFGGGRTSHFLLEHPESFQVDIDGSHRAAGCHVNPGCRGHIEHMIDEVAALGFQGYFIDEPQPLVDCFCQSCNERFTQWYGSKLGDASHQVQSEFRARCVIDYVQTISAYCKTRHPSLETLCCIQPENRQLWQSVATIDSLDNLGTDLYWVNENRDVQAMRPIIRGLDTLCRRHGKRHHQWLQCWGVNKGNEERIRQQGEILADEQPDGLYVWAWQGQIGTSESCENPGQAWLLACEVLRHAKESL